MLCLSGVEEIYRTRPEFAESATDIYNSLAAAALMEIGKPNKDLLPDQEEPAARVLENLQKAEQHVRMNEFSWIIKGFYELKQGWKVSSKFFENPLVYSIIMDL